MKKGKQAQQNDPVLEQQRQKLFKQITEDNSHSFIIAKDVINQVLEHFDKELRDIELLKKIVPYNSVFILEVLRKIAIIKYPKHDERQDLQYEGEEEEPPIVKHDNFFPQYAAVKENKVLQIDEHMKKEQQEDARSQKRNSLLRRGATKLTLSVFKRVSSPMQTDSTPQSAMLSRRKHKDQNEFEAYKQYKLEEPEKKPYEIMDQQTQIMIERLRQMQIKKQQMKQQQLRKLRQKKDSQKSSLGDLMYFDNNPSLAHLMHDSSAFLQSQTMATTQFNQMKTQTQKVKVDRLPKTVVSNIKVNLSQVQPVNQETDYSRLIKRIQQERMEEKGFQNLDVASNFDMQQDYDQLLNTSGLPTGNQMIVLADYQVPLRKVIKTNYGVTYQDKNAVIQGEHYSTKPSKRLQFTRQKFLEHSQQIEQKYLKSGTQLERSLARRQETKTQVNSPIGNKIVAFSTNEESFDGQQQLKHGHRRNKSSLNSIKLLNNSALLQIVSPNHDYSQNGFPKDGNYTGKHSNLNRTNNFMFPQVKTPSHHFDQEGQQSQNTSFDFKSTQDLLRQEIRQLKSTSKFLSQSQNVSKERIVQFQPESQLHEITSLHDRLNYMITQNQDPSVLMRQIYPNFGNRKRSSNALSEMSQSQKQIQKNKQILRQKRDHS